MKDLLKKRIHILFSLGEFLNPRKKDIVKIAIGKVLILILGLLGLFVNKFIIDDVILQKKIEWLAWICLGMISIYFLETLTMSAVKHSENKAYNKIAFLIKSKMWRFLVKQSNAFYEAYDIGDLKNRLDNDMLAVEKFLPEQVVYYLFEAITTAAIAVIIIFMNWKLAFFGLGVLPLVFMITSLMAKNVTNAVENYRSIWGEYEEWIVNDIKGWKEVKALNIQKKEQVKFVAYWKKLCIYNFKKWIFWFANTNFIIIKDTFIVNLSIYFVGALLIFNGEITVGGLLVFKGYYEKMMLSLNKVNDLDMKMSNDLPAIQRVVQIIEKTLEKEEGKTKLEDVQGELLLENVFYKYKGKKEYSLYNINLTIKKGQKLAIVGKSGCGKSTLIKLILGLYRPEQGKITIDGLALDRVAKEDIYECIGVVMQDNILFNMTIEENLRLAKPSATMEEIIEACEYSSMIEVINKLPDGFNTIVGESGTKLSGGQKQRLCIARVMLRKPKIIIFDEATSALDYQSEKVINEAIERISKERTVLVVAHRLSSIVSMNQVIVLDKGRIVGNGAHKELLDNNAYYQNLFGVDMELQQA